MKYERFSEIWDKYMPKDMVWVSNEKTIKALIGYGEGNKTEINAIRKLLKRN